MKNNEYGHRLFRSELRYCATLGGLILMAPAALGMLLMLLPTVQATDNWAVDGASGMLHIRGALTESACRLEMSSARQAVWLGETGTAQLQRPGDRGVPVGFELRLVDCLRSPAATRDERTGGLVWAPNQPAVRVSFDAPADMDNPQLVKAEGASGLALRLLDPNGRDIRLGSHGAPLQLTQGQNALRFRVMPERTLAPLVAGGYQAALFFRLSYE
ncbi:fimbrial protein [Serratia entomophila]|uniref:fimbrial protein n=1 Tax=Serratia entomophila TaxID=42906 RepID=UPI00217886EE|nr:fimbrial protein [Serratia entomophila]CAI0927781.1 S-fimbrillin [Serratia entomophila]CAI1541219.1 S-fimbrillin [Serratia entomophila]CAI1663098.1 S-fimbrillin [Serratia entomophila]CAI1744597.1 S-fimbrillin [Serratia entomophila]CAI1775461.1 S-fimbrillin [Serratia entomophila]